MDDNSVLLSRRWVSKAAKSHASHEANIKTVAAEGSNASVFMLWIRRFQSDLAWPRSFIDKIGHDLSVTASLYQ